MKEGPRSGIFLAVFLLTISVSALPDISGEKIASDSSKPNSGPPQVDIGGGENPLCISGILGTTIQIAIPPLGRYAEKWQIVKLEGRLRLNASFKKNGFEALLQTDLYLYPEFETDPAPRRSGGAIRQGWIRFTGHFLEITTGWQMFSWGNADFFPTANVLDRPDFADLTVLDRSLRYRGTFGLKARLFTGNTALELVWLPAVFPAAMPQESGFWRFEYADIGTIPVKENNAPDPGIALDNGAFALRWGGSNGGIDFQLGWYYGPQRGLLLQSTMISNTATAALSIEKNPAINRVHCFTANAGFTTGKAVLRAELLFSPDMPAATYVADEALATAAAALSPGNSSIPIGTVSSEPYLAWTAGGDILLWGTAGRLLVEWKHDLYLKGTGPTEDFRISDIIALLLQDSFANGRVTIRIGALFTKRKEKHLGAAGYTCTWDFGNGFSLSQGTFLFAGIGCLQARYRF